MGVKIGKIVQSEKIGLKDLKGKTLAIDAMNTLYAFLATIKLRSGELLRDHKGRITSHLSGLFYRTINFMEQGIRPVYVFNGRPPELKHKVLEIRRKVRMEKKMPKLTGEMVSESKQLLDHMGVPFVQAPAEGEAQAAYMVKKGGAWAVASQDMDTLLFGAPMLVRNLAVTGRKKTPMREEYVFVSPELISLDKTLGALGIDYEQLVTVGILTGTDYNRGIKGIGPKKALDLVKEYGSLKEILHTDLGTEFEVDPLEVFDIFTRPHVIDYYDIKWRGPQSGDIKRFLCDERDFSEERVKAGISRLLKSASVQDGHY